jgi:hypothetical protein
MLITQNLWHPAGESRQYEAVGSRTSFSNKWNPKAPHTYDHHESNTDPLQLMIDVLTDDQKKRWHYAFNSAA